MKTKIPAVAKSAPSSSRTQSFPAQSSGASTGHLAQLAALANQSPQVQAQRKLAEDLQCSSRVEAQRNLAAQINAAAPAAQLERLKKKPAMQPKLDDKLKQPKYAADAGTAQLEQAPSANRTGLPDHLKAGVESLSGVSLDSVKVHYNSPKPAQLNALAYAQGTDIHVAPGQQKHLPHEAWHVAQQSQGRVKPTTQAKGVAINDDSSLEREADVMGAKAATAQMADKRKKK